MAAPDWRLHGDQAPTISQRSGLRARRRGYLAEEPRFARGARLVTCGNTAGYDVKLDLPFLFSKQWSLLGSFMGTMGELHAVLKFVFRKELKPVIDKVYPLSEIRAAHERVENKEQFGKVVVVP